MRVLMVAHAFPPTIGGVETYLWDLTNHLGRRGHQAHCLVGDRNGLPDQYGLSSPLAGVTRHPELAPVALVGARGHVQRSAVAWALADRLTGLLEAAVAGFGPDLLHVHNAHHFGPELALACFRAAAGRPLVNTVHDRLGERLYPEVLDYPWHATLYVSEHVRAGLPSAAPIAAVLPPGIDLATLGPEGPTDPRLAILAPPVVFHPARLLPWKGTMSGVEAFALLRGSLGAGSLVLCASADTTADPAEAAAFRRQLEDRAFELGVAERVVFVELAREQMAAAYRAADLVWAPTVDDESFGLAPLEAMACGVPVVVSASGGMRETVEPGLSGLVVPKADPVALAGAAVAVLADTGLRARLVAGGLARAARFDAGDHARAVERAYAAAAAAAAMGEGVPGGRPA